MRRAAFEENVRLIRQLNAEHDAGRHAAALLGYVTLVRQIGPHFAALENLDRERNSGRIAGRLQRQDVRRVGLRPGPSRRLAWLHGRTSCM